MQKHHHWLRGLIVFVFIIVGAIFAVTLLHRHTTKPAARIDALADVLKQAAEKRLAPPAIANDQIIITDAPEKIESRAKEVVDSAIAVNGTAVKTTNADGSVTLLAQIPDQNAGQFRGLVSKGQFVKEGAAREGRTRLIEVIIRAQSGAEPSPSDAQLEK